MNDLRGTLANITKNVTKTSGDFLRTTKLSMSLSTEETNLKNLYMDIGKKVHEIYQYGGSLGKFFDEKYLEIQNYERKIAEIKDQIDMIKGTRTCAVCGKSMERTAEFCPKCGTRIDPGVLSAHESAPPAAGYPQQPPNLGEPPPPPPQAFSEQAPPPAPVAWEAAPEAVAEIPPPAPPPPNPPPTPNKICRICGKENKQNAKFCLSCGRIVD